MTDARNALDTAAYQVERLLTERGDALPVHEKARAENLVADARQALKEDTPTRPAADPYRRAAAGLPVPGDGAFGRAFRRPWPAVGSRLAGAAPPMTTT